ncbi:MAG: hypothetical protein COB54_04730 [Alphaproteobacteria bacterium]|nr:MAG: hypothetical protein COB54_04730 [Alphaproteobacteria bacterium]
MKIPWAGSREEEIGLVRFKSLPSDASLISDAVSETEIKDGKLGDEWGSFELGICFSFYALGDGELKQFKRTQLTKLKKTGLKLRSYWGNT